MPDLAPPLPAQYRHSALVALDWMMVQAEANVDQHLASIECLTPQHSISQRRKLAGLEKAIVRAETRLTQYLERLEWRRAAGQGTATAEILVRDAEKDLARLHRHRQGMLQAKPGR